MQAHCKTKPAPRVLLVEANNMGKWVGTTMPYEVHIPPLGLMYLASYARKALPGVEFRIFESSLSSPDLSSLENDSPENDRFIRILNEFQPDVVGIRSIAFFLEELQRIASLVRAHSDATLVAGGPIVQAYKRRLFQEVPELEIAVKGEGEKVFVDLLSGSPLSSIAGLLYRTDDGVVENEDQLEVEDIDSLPFPTYDLIDLNQYQSQLSYAYNHRRQGVLLTSRGCAYHCTFCFTHWKGIRLRSAANIFEEIKQLHEQHGIEDFYVVDDIFNVNSKRALKLFDLIVAAGLKLRLYFVNGLRADITSEEFVDRAIEAGAVWFTYAVESGTDEIQRLVEKRLDLEKAKRVIAYTQRQNVAVNVSTMYGFPTETRELAQRTLDWLSELPKPSLLPYHFCLRFFPGCEINQQALDAGWDPARLELTSRFSYNDMPLGTPTLSKQDMYGIQLEYHRRFGLSNPAAVDGAVRTLRSIGYSDTEIVHMYSVLKRKVIHNVGDLMTAGGN
ncbi:putative Radical SAM domain protein [Candidatus Sulfotelmatobacter sp. SbA7]|nr:putative Radical SAM domain protein [Candidatus Sulfotelmatobacter sp. SbA7]